MSETKGVENSLQEIIGNDRVSTCLDAVILQVLDQGHSKEKCAAVCGVPWSTLREWATKRNVARKDVQPLLELADMVIPLCPETTACCLIKYYQYMGGSYRVRKAQLRRLASFARPQMVGYISEVEDVLDTKGLRIFEYGDDDQDGYIIMSNTAFLACATRVVPDEYIAKTKCEPSSKVHILPRKQCTDELQEDDDLC